MSDEVLLPEEWSVFDDEILCLVEERNAEDVAFFFVEEGCDDEELDCT